MEIYVVQQGDTIDSIAMKFGISNEKLIMDNGIKAPYNLVVGQTIVIIHPTQVYIVNEGDTLVSIAEAFQITVMQLLRNNPFLANREYIYPGETLTIRFNNNKGNTYVVGYTYPFIREGTLKMTLPYLAYVLLFDYIVDKSGNIIGSGEDEFVIETAKMYQTRTTLVVTSYSLIGEVNLEVENTVLQNQMLQNKLVDNILVILKEKGYNGVNLAFQFITVSNQELYISFLTLIWNRLRLEGYSVFLTVNPRLSFQEDGVTFEKIDYARLSSISDGLLILSYDWGITERPPLPYSIITTSSFLEYLVDQVPLDKIRIELPTLGYDWQLPFVAGKSKANALNYDSVLSLASQMNAVIRYDESSLSAYFEYLDANNEPHIVRFMDARSIDSSIKILQSYGITGIGIWNIMYYFNQLWLVINTQYEIVKL